MNASNKEPTIDLKNPIAAAILGFLLPGAGHFYQGRTFKAIIYFVCITTLFCWGMQIGEWKLVYRLEPQQAFDFDQANFNIDDDRARELMRQLGHQGPSRNAAKTHWGYYAQVPIGLFSVPAFIQEERYYSPNNQPLSPETMELNEQVEGLLSYVDEAGKEYSLEVSGTIQLGPQEGEYGLEMAGTFEGTIPEGEAVKIELRGSVSLDPPIGANADRSLRSSASRLDGKEIFDGVLTARIERSFLNRFLVPPDYQTLEAMHSELGKKFTLAEVFTWIAGLLNVLAIWDAFAGPAYGYRMPSKREKTTAADNENSSNETNDTKSEPQPVGTKS